MVVTNMKELLIYAEQQKKLRASEHRRRHAHDGLCSGLTDVEYNRMTVRQKSTFSKLESSLTTVCGEIIQRNLQ
jgi:hypothetical protein